QHLVHLTTALPDLALHLSHLLLDDLMIDPGPLALLSCLLTLTFRLLARLFPRPSRLLSGSLALALTLCFLLGAICLLARLFALRLAPILLGKNQPRRKERRGEQKCTKPTHADSCCAAFTATPAQPAAFFERSGPAGFRAGRCTALKSPRDSPSRAEVVR